MTHLAGNESATDEERRLHQASALYTCEHGLEDPDTHQLYRFSLARRQAKLHALDGLHDPSINLSYNNRSRIGNQLQRLLYIGLFSRIVVRLESKPCGLVLSIILPSQSKKSP
ncbi:hypothetical protein Pst134EB_006364 [Puccinia striiformis f. sp. tritici]|nr:hypothetical protein Pst134EB_006364 [Puccinia striiformis f. sp. tritici]